MYIYWTDNFHMAYLTLVKQCKRQGLQWSPCGWLNVKQRHMICVLRSRTLCQVTARHISSSKPKLINCAPKILWERILFDAVHQWSITVVIHNALQTNKNSSRKMGMCRSMIINRIIRNTFFFKIKTFEAKAFCKE